MIVSDKQRRTALLCSSALAFVTLAGAAAAQTAPATTAQEPETTEVEEVVVTGSRIRRDPANAPTPVIQVTGEQLRETGQSTMIDYLATIPALSTSFVPSDTTGNGLNDGGLSLPNLRALGANRTLTLVDGLRHVGSSGGALSVDVDTIPRLLIQNVEIITGGASSVYGADAVSGVLNFVLRKDFEGLEIDANYGMINQDGEANKRISMLIGANLLDDRLNLWTFGEYEQLDELRAENIDWLRDSWSLEGFDADPTNPAIGPASDGVIDAETLRDVRTLQRLRWGVVTLANNQQASPLNDPDITYNNCGAIGAAPTAALLTNVNCTLQNPGSSYVFEGAGARLANFGTRVGTGLARYRNVGGDGESAAEYGQYTFFPRGESARFSAGANFALTPDITARFEAKYIEEETFDMGQPTFFDIFINNARPEGQVSAISSSQAFSIRLDDNAFIPTTLRTAIQNNRVNIYSEPTATTPSTLIGTAPAPYARNAVRGPDRSQTNTRELTRYVAALGGDYDKVSFVKDVRWDMSFTHGAVEIANLEEGVDVERMAFAADAVVDTAGEVSGRPGEIVCRVQLLNARGIPMRSVNPTTGAVINAGIQDAVRSGDVRASATGRAAINECEPLNVFGNGNQSPESIEYIYAAIGVTQRNEQDQALVSLSGNLWDLFGAGAIGAAVGAEYRREFTEGTGRDRDTGDRFLFLNTGPDTPGVQYESKEVFGEVSVPLFRDSWLGEFGEISGSYRSSVYSTVGKADVHGINLVYRPIEDVTFRSSFNTSQRAPSLNEQFGPLSQTFANFSATDPCTTANINAAANSQFRENRIRNCAALAALQGLTFDFAGSTGTNTDDFNPAYGTGGTAGSSGGNRLLKPEQSESFTFSTVLQPRFFPDFDLILDYYEIDIEDVIATVTAAIAATNCVNGSELNEDACRTIIRRNPTIPFGIGAPTGDPIGGFIQGSINYAKRTTRGMDFTARYRLDLEEAFGREWGRLDYRVAGSWLLEQDQYNNAANPNDMTPFASTIGLPRVRLSSSLTYTPNDIWNVNWTVDWQTAQDNAGTIRSFSTTGNGDARNPSDINTGDFARHDLTLRWNAREDLSMRLGVVNAFDAEQARYLGSVLSSNFDPYGRRFFVGLSYRPY